jgi:hypothetical protein
VGGIANALILKNFFLGGGATAEGKIHEYFLNDYLGGVNAERNEKWSRDMVDPHPPMLLTIFFLW